MSDHHPGEAQDDGGLADPASSHGSDFDPRLGDDEEEDRPDQTEGGDQAGP